MLKHNAKLTPLVEKIMKKFLYGMLQRTCGWDTGSSAMLRIFILAACIALPGCQAAHAPSSPVSAKIKLGSLNQQFEGIDTARSATVVIEPMVYYIHDTAGNCILTTQDPALIASLINMLMLADVRVERKGRWPNPMREYISLKLVNGEEVKFSFGLIVPASQGDVKGEFIRGDDSKARDDDYLALSAKKTLHKDLYEWAAKVEESTPQADRKQKYCSYVHMHLFNLSRCSAIATESARKAANCN